MERKLNGKESFRQKVEWKQSGNGKDMEWKEIECNHISNWIRKWDVNGKGIDGILLLFAWNFQMDKNGKVLTFWSLPYDSIPFNSIPFHGTSTFH